MGVVPDAYTDHRKMPPNIEAAEDALWALGKRQHKRDPGMNVELDLTNADAWDLLEKVCPVVDQRRRVRHCQRGDRPLP